MKKIAPLLQISCASPLLHSTSYIFSRNRRNKDHCVQLCASALTFFRVKEFIPILKMSLWEIFLDD